MNLVLILCIWELNLLNQYIYIYIYMKPCAERVRERASNIRFMTWRISKETRDFSHIPYNQVKVVGTKQSYWSRQG